MIYNTTTAKALETVKEAVKDICQDVEYAVPGPGPTSIYIKLTWKREGQAALALRIPFNERDLDSERHHQQIVDDVVSRAKHFLEKNEVRA